MRPSGKKTAAILAGLLLFACARTVFAVTYDYDYDFEDVDDDYDGPSIISSQDIIHAQHHTWDYLPYRAFMIKLYGSVDTSTTTYGFFLNSGSGYNFSEYSILFGRSVDAYFTQSGGKWNISADTYKDVDFKDKFIMDNSPVYYIYWEIYSDQLPNSFTWFTATLDNTSGAWKVIDNTAIYNPGHTHPPLPPRPSPVPIPGSLILFGSGLLGLIGIGRKRLKK